MKLWQVLTIPALAILAAQPLSADTTYIQASPLAQQVKVVVADATDPTVLSLPFISWGGDLATILANGGTRETSGGAFAEAGLKFRLTREDVFARQVADYLSGKTPYLRGTVAMLNLAAPLTEADPRTKMQIIYQMTWSAGGDALVVKGGVKSPRDLRGKKIALQANGPHIDYLAKLLADAGLSLKDVELRWTKDITGTEQSPAAALRAGTVDAAMVISPDALALSSQGKVGTGAEQSVQGARILLSTKTANRVIADVYAVRTDYYEAHRDKVKAFVRALLKSQLALAKLVKAPGTAESKSFFRGAAELLLDSPEAAADALAMYGDAEFTGAAANRKFFQDPAYPRSLKALNAESQASLLALGFIQRKASLQSVSWDYSSLAAGGDDGVEAQRFDSSAVAKVVARQSKEEGAPGELFAFEIRFGANQNSFDAGDYKEAFDRVISLASTYGGAVITVEGHSDPLGYLRKKKEGETGLVLTRIKQSAKNLSLARATAVKDALLKYSQKRSVQLDPSQLALVGHGIEKPKSGLCGDDPCAPKDEAAWKANMRVEFRILQVEAEESVFRPL